MSRSKPRAKRPHDSIHRSQGFRSDLDLSDDCTPLQSSITSASEFLLSDIKSARSNPKLETMSDTSHAKESCLRNGFHPKSLKSDNENDVCTPSSDGNAADMYLKTSTNGTAFNVFEHTKRIMDDKESNTLSDVKDRNLPKYEESFIEGFSVMAFSSAADMNIDGDSAAGTTFSAAPVLSVNSRASYWRIHPLPLQTHLAHSFPPTSDAEVGGRRGGGGVDR